MKLSNSSRSNVILTTRLRLLQQIDNNKDNKYAK